MKKSTLTALTVGVLGIGALGVWWGMHRDTTIAAPPAAAAAPATDAAKPARATAPRVVVRHTDKTTIAPDVVASLPATQPELHERLKPVLNRGTRMDAAAEGFRDAEQFATVAHAARNTGVPFAVLKHRVLEQDQTLVRAIRESKPDVDAEHEATRARNAARFDIAVITG